MKKFVCIALAVVGQLFLSSGIASAQWGDLKMKFVVNGKAPVMKPLMATKDPAVCANPKNPKLLEETFVVGNDGGIQNVLIYLVPDTKTKLKIHPDYEVSAKDTVVLDNVKCRFEPHVLTVRVGQTFELKSSDPVGHNSNVAFTTNNPINPTLPPLGTFKVKPADLTKPERRATPVSCSIHPWMTAWVMVQDHPYMAVSDADGVVEIKNLPVGKHTFQLWQERDGYLNPTGSAKFVKGKAEIEIKAGMNDLKELKVKPKD